MLGYAARLTRLARPMTEGDLVPLRNAGLADEEIRDLAKGVELSDGRTLPCQVRKIEKTEKNSWLEMTIREGRNRQIRRMLEKLDHTVLKLKRVRLGRLVLGSLALGKFRYLTPQEIRALKGSIESPRRSKTGTKMSRAVGE